MKKIKVLVASFLLCFLVFAENAVWISADEVQQYGIFDAGYDLVIEDGNIVEVSKNGTIVVSAEYIDGLRVLKNGQYSAQFTYEDRYIVNEVRDGNSIEYFFEYDENCDMRYSGFIFAGNTYNYIWDDEGKIVKKEVVTGFSDGVNVESIEGVSEGEIVLIESRVSDE